MDRKGDFLFEPIMTERNIKVTDRDLTFVNELADKVDTTTPLIVFFGFEKGGGWIGSPSYNHDGAGYAGISGICLPGHRASITEIRNHVSLLNLFTGGITVIDIDTTARVSVSSI